MKVASNNDTILINHNRFVFDAGDELYLHPLSEIKRIFIMTTAQLVLNQTVFLVFETETEFYLMGITHPDFQHVLNDVSGIFDVDQNVIIEAMQNVGQKQFTLYQKG
ncbi:MAG: hypothetical protein IIY33_02080 [Erysipelotrichaceae bacterium]|nr:hypothetical protein [Erysipelotrichaceae bacterium]